MYFGGAGVLGKVENILFISSWLLLSHYNTNFPLFKLLSRFLSF